MARFGVHNSIAGGLTRAIELGVRLGCDCIQMFVKNQRQWRARPLTDEQVAQFKAARAATAIAPVVVHDNYLINLACPQPVVWQRSYDAFIDELDRCDRLGVEFLVTHPGSHLGQGESGAIDVLADSLNRIYADRPGDGTITLLECTAGQGSNIGYRFEQLAAVLSRLDRPDRFGICLDTCHLFAAGYDIRTPESVADTLGQFDRIIGLARLRAMHMNDSKRELGSRVDRHEHIGDGLIGRAGFWSIIHDARLSAMPDLPMILETPKGEGEAEQFRADRRNLRRLRALASLAEMPAGAKSPTSQDGLFES